MTEADESSVLYARVFLYEMAHTVFSGEPDDALFGVLCSPECRDTLRSVRKGREAVAALAEYCDELDADDAQRAAELAEARSDYNRVVAGLGASRSSYPWESAYTNSKRLLFQAETLEVRNAYRSFGYLPELYPKVSDDHIALECAFLSALAQKTVGAEGGERERLVRGQQAFLHDHLLKWVGSYARDLHDDAPDGLYDLMVRALLQYAEEDERFLAGLYRG